MNQYQRREGKVIRVDPRNGRVSVNLQDTLPPLCVWLPSTAFVGGLTHRVPTEGDRAIVSFSNGSAVSGKILVT